MTKLAQLGPLERARLLEAVRFVESTAARRDKLVAVEAIGRRHEPALASVFRQQGRAFAAELGELEARFVEARRLNLSEAPGPGEWEPVWERAASRLTAKLQRTLESIAGEGLKAGARAAIGRLNIDLAFDLQNPRAVSFMTEHGADLVTNINATTRDYMRTLLSESVEKGWSYARTARAIRERFDGFATGSPLKHIRSRAELVSVTESSFAYEDGNRQMAERLRSDLPAGIGMEKAWLTVGDERVDEAVCMTNEAEGWIAFEESHATGHDEPPAHPGCRCTEMYQTVKVRA